MLDHPQVPISCLSSIARHRTIVKLRILYLKRHNVRNRAVADFAPNSPHSSYLFLWSSGSRDTFPVTSKSPSSLLRVGNKWLHPICLAPSLSYVFVLRKNLYPKPGWSGIYSVAKAQPSPATTSQVYWDHRWGQSRLEHNHRDYLLSLHGTNCLTSLRSSLRQKSTVS